MSTNRLASARGDESATVATGSASTDLVPFGQALRVWMLISLQTFGGPAGQIAVMQHSLVDQKRWIGQKRFLHALNYCMLLPGPEAQQLAIYVGWLLNGTLGGLIAGTLFVIPGAISSPRGRGGPMRGHRCRAWPERFRTRRRRD